MKTYQLKINGNQYAVEVNEITGNHARVNVNGSPYEVTLDTPSCGCAKSTTTSQTATPIATPVAAPVATPVAGNGGTVKASLPGTILEVKVKVGDPITAGQCLMILEAMKMENNVNSDKSGVVKEIKVGVGSSVLEGDTLIVLN